MALVEQSVLKLLLSDNCNSNISTEVFHFKYKKKSDLRSMISSKLFLLVDLT